MITWAILGAITELNRVLQGDSASHWKSLLKKELNVSLVVILPGLTPHALPLLQENYWSTEEILEIRLGLLLKGQQRGDSGSPDSSEIY
jgi:hypothetical protein